MIGSCGLRIGALALWVLLMFAGTAFAVAEPIGLVVARRGVVKAVTPDGQARLLQVQDPLNLDDVIVTTQDARIQMLFRDNTIISLGPNSTMKVTAYRWDVQTKSGTMKTEIKDGVFRVIGGLITKHSPKEFLTSTPMADIGIRGSMFAGVIANNQLNVLFLGGTGIEVGNQLGRITITQPGFGTKIKAGDAPEMPTQFSPREVAPISNGLNDGFGGEMIEEIVGPEGVSVVEKQQGECDGPDCAWYQKLLNTLEEAEDKANASRVCTARTLELENLHRETLAEVGQQIQAQMDRALLAWQTGEVLRSISKGAWEAAKFLGGDLSTPARVVEELTKALYGSEETEKGLTRLGGMAAGDRRAYEAQAAEYAKGQIKDYLEKEGFPPSVAKGAAEGFVTNVTNAIDAGKEKGFTKMAAADVAAQAVLGYVQGLNEERKQYIKEMEGELSLNSQMYAASSQRIAELQKALPTTDALLAEIRSEKEKLLALARECELARRKTCWDAYDRALSEANEQFGRVVQAQQDAEKAADDKAAAAARESQALRERLIAVYQEIAAVEQTNGDLLGQYRRAEIELEAAEEQQAKARQDADRDRLESGGAGYSQTYIDLLLRINEELQQLRTEVKQLEAKAKPVEQQLAALREEADKGYPQLKELDERQKTLDTELGELRAKQKTERETAGKQRNLAVEKAQQELDQCLANASAGLDSKEQVPFTMERQPGADRCSRLVDQARATLEAVRRNNHPRSVKVPCPGKDKAPGVTEIGPATGECCKTPLKNSPVELGPKSKIGGGLAKVVNDFASKMIGAGLSSLFGGGGLSFGGGGDGDSSGPQGPTTFKNPVRNLQPFTVPGTEIKLKVGGMITDDGKLLISSEIDNSPGKGTYHSVTLHNLNCQQMYPTRYIPYGLYLEWSLSVQYTYITEHYVDGQLVNREVEQTDWATVDTWEEQIGAGAVAVQGKDPRMAQPGIWQQFGFDRATAGIDALGAVFNVGYEELKNQPLAVSINITQPDLDPVTAVPLNLFPYLDEDNKISFVPVDDVMKELRRTMNDGQLARNANFASSATACPDRSQELWLDSSGKLVPKAPAITLSEPADLPVYIQASRAFDGDMGK